MTSRHGFVARAAFIVVLGLLIALAVPLFLGVASAFPDEGSTGPLDESKVPASPSGHIRTDGDGQMIENAHASYITIRHDNVTVRNFRVTINDPNTSFGIKLVRKADGEWPTNTLIEYGEITSRDSSGNPQPSRAKGVRTGRDIVVRGVEISYMEDGLHCGAGNCTFVDNYIHHLVKYQDAHNDGIVVSGGSGVVIRHNTVLLPNQQTGAVSIFPDGSAIDDVLVENNYLNGGSYTIYSRTMDHGTPTNVRVIDNHFGRDYNAGIFSFDGDVVTQGNVWADNGQPVDNEQGAIPDPSGRFIDDDGHTFEGSIEWLADQRITLGCNPPANDRFCPDDFVTRGQMAAFLVRAFTYTADGGGDLFEDDDGSTFESAIDKLGTAGVTLGCNPPANDRFCPDDFVTRGQMAAFLKRAFE